MNEVKSSVSQGQSYQEIGEYWDNHDLGEVWEQTQPADFVVSGHAKTIYENGSECPAACGGDE